MKCKSASIYHENILYEKTKISGLLGCLPWKGHMVFWLVTLLWFAKLFCAELPLCLSSSMKLDPALQDSDDSGMQSEVSQAQRQVYYCHFDARLEFKANLRTFFCRSCLTSCPTIPQAYPLFFMTPPSTPPLTS